MRLTEFEPFVQSANIRSQLDYEHLTVTDGTGKEGDLILGEVIPGQNVLKIIDHNGKVHVVNTTTRVMAVLGNRESSTNVNGYVPDEGFIINEGLLLDWIGGESGLIGKCEMSPLKNDFIHVETSSQFMCLGVVKNRSKNLNVFEFSLKPKNNEINLPIILIGATSTEAGKTVLACKIIELLTALGWKVAALKLTGCGGVLDTLEHKKAGARITFDQVDCGLITSYTNKKKFREHISKAFLASQDCDADIIVGELGGDLISANVDTLLKMTTIMKSVQGIFVICNDSIAAYGVNLLLEDFNLSHPFFLVSSPFRNYLGMKRRIFQLTGKDLIDPNDVQQIRNILSRVLDIPNSD